MQTTNSNHVARGAVLTILGGICWGFSGSCGQYLFTYHGVESDWLTCVRMLSAGVLLILLGLLKDRSKLIGMLKSPQDMKQLLVFSIVGLVFCQYTYLMAIQYTNAGTATVLQYTGPVMILLVTCLMARRLPKRREIVAICLAVGGTFLLATHGDIHNMVLTPRGLAWGLVSAVALACYTMIPIRIIQKWGSIVVIGCGMFIGGVVFSLFTGFWTMQVQLAPSGVLALVAILLVGTVFAYTAYSQGVAEIGAVRGSMLCSIEPVSAMLISGLWLKTAFTWIDVLGSACIIATILLLAKKEEA